MDIYFLGRIDHCNKTVDIYEDITSPEVTSSNFGKPLYCSYRFRPFKGTPKDYILRIRFKKFKFGVLVNGTYCQGGFMQVTNIFFIIAALDFKIIIIIIKGEY